MKFPILLLILLVAACAPLSDPTGEPSEFPPDTAVTSPPADNMPTIGPTTNPFSPKPGDANLTRGMIYIEEASLVVRESYPPQISLSMRGNLPTPCHALRVEIPSPDQENKIMVEAYSVVDPSLVCTQVLEPFQEFIDLGTFPSGHYSVWVNGELAGEFDS
ncbi:MAG: hypothetical protein ACXW4U_02845 [Anaerolineales bacterium]